MDGWMKDKFSWTVSAEMPRLPDPPTPPPAVLGGPHLLQLFWDPHLLQLFWGDPHLLQLFWGDPHLLQLTSGSRKVQF
uniref:Uncharacterized protein n=1 Tax=Neogobius melanostomus TaxID=47308 RepID=A0A8C6S7U0_9GOBI